MSRHKQESNRGAANRGRVTQEDDAVVRWEEGEFPALDGTRLWRRSALPTQGAMVARICFLTGYGDHGGRYTHFMGWMAERGVAVHALDFRGQGRAGGRRGYITRWSEYLDDLDAFLALPEIRGAGPLFLQAQSHGSLVIIHYLLRGGAPPAGAIFTAPYIRNRVPTSPGKLLLAQLANQVVPYLEVATDVPRDWMSHDLAMQEEDAADPLSLGIATPRWFITAQEAQAEALRRAPDFTIPLLMITGTEDQVADNIASEEFFAAVGSTDKTHIAAAPCRHEPLRESDRETHFRRIYDWIREHTAALV